MHFYGGSHPYKGDKGEQSFFHLLSWAYSLLLFYICQTDFNCDDDVRHILCHNYWFKQGLTLSIPLKIGSFESN